MSEKFYTKETGWTEAGVKEQERRGDLTKLTIELIGRMVSEEMWNEIHRKLERLEKCEAALKQIYQLAARSLAEPLNESTPYVVDICTIIETLDMAIVDAARAALEEK